MQEVQPTQQPPHNGFHRDKIILVRKQRQYNTLPTPEAPAHDDSGRIRGHPRKSFDIAVVKKGSGDDVSSSDASEKDKRLSPRYFKVSRVAKTVGITSAHSVDSLVMEISVSDAKGKQNDFDPLIDVF